MTDGSANEPVEREPSSARRGWTPPNNSPRNPDVFSPVLGKSQRQWEKEMRVWYVLLGIVCFFAVFGEGILVMVSKRRDARAAHPSSPASVPAATRDSTR